MSVRIRNRHRKRFVTNARQADAPKFSLNELYRCTLSIRSRKSRRCSGNRGNVGRNSLRVDLCEKQTISLDGPLIRVRLTVGDNSQKQDKEQSRGTDHGLLLLRKKPDSWHRKAQG